MDGPMLRSRVLNAWKVEATCGKSKFSSYVTFTHKNYSLSIIFLSSFMAKTSLHPHCESIQYSV